MLVATIVAAALIGACNKTERTPAAPSPVTGPLTGVWTGTLTRVGSRQSVRMELTEVQFGGFVANGTYTASDSTGTTSGTVGGVAFGADVSLILTPSTPPPCTVAQPFPAGHVQMTLTLAGTTMAGNAAFTLCGNSVSGTATFAK